MSSVPCQHLGIDLNEAVCDPDLLDLDLVIDLKQPVRSPLPVADVYLNCPPADPNDVQEDTFDLNNPVFSDVNEEDREQALWEPDLTEAHACQKETPPCCEPGLNLNEAKNSGQLLVLLPDLNELPGAVGAPKARKQYSDDTKRAVYAMLLEGSRGGRLPDGLTHQVSLSMDVSLRYVQRIWNAGQKGGGIHAVASKKANCGRKRIEVSHEAITAIPLKDRTSLENVARGLGMARSTVFRRVKEGRIERHSVAIHPLLRNEGRGFNSKCNVTHMDKKWFYGKKSNQKFYCAPGEVLKEQ